MSNVLQIFLGFLFLPFFWILWGAVLFIRLWEGVKGRDKKIEESPFPERSDRKASVIILNWNGRALLQENLGSVVQAVWQDNPEHEIMVVDNGSQDDSIPFLQEHFPDIRVLSLPENIGFSEGNNYGVRQARHPIVVLLNNDMRVPVGFLRPLLEGFGEDVFAVSAQIQFSDSTKKREETGKTMVSLNHGFFSFAHQNLESWDQRRKYIPIFWAGGGSSAFRRDRFLQLNGFSEMYSPCYVEDTDLSYRAWKRGWKILLATDSLVFHQHRASSKKRFREKELSILIQRNQFIFAWRNLYDWKPLFFHGALFPIFWLKILTTQGGFLWKALPQALQLSFPLLAARWREPAVVCNDRQIFHELEERYRYYAQSRKAAESKSSCAKRLRILMITAYLPHLGYHAGAGRMFHLMRRIARNHDVSLLTFVENEQEKERSLPLYEFCSSVRILIRNPDYIGSLFIYEPFDAFYSTAFLQALHQELEREDFDILHYEYAQMASYVRKNCPIPQILTEHEVNFAACRIQAALKTNIIQKLSWYYNYMQVMQREIQLLQNPDKVIFMTPKDAGYFAGSLHEEKISVIRTGVDLDYFHPQPTCREEPYSMVFVGSFTHHPNCDAMLYFCQEVFPRIQDQFPQTRLYIAGSNPPGTICALAENPGIFVTGYREDLRPLMAKACLYVVPLRLGVGIRGKVLEAWSMARPVIATGLACAGLPVKHTHNIWIADTTEEFIQGITNLFQEQAVRNLIGQEGRKTAEEHFSWELAACRLESLYKRQAGIPDAASSPTAASQRIH